MKRLTARAAVLVLVAAAIAAFSCGCSDDAAGPPGDAPPYKDLTDPQHCIENLVIAYRLRDIEGYATILHEDYIWYGKKWGAFEDTLDSYNYTQDIEFTADLFQDAMALDLEIDPGTWQEIEKIGEEPCTGCRQTDRVCRIQVQFRGDKTLYPEHDLVNFIVIPVDEGGKTKYKIRLVYGIDYYLARTL